MTKHHYNKKMDIPQDADSVRYFIPEGYTARIEDGVLIIEPKESEGEKIRKEIVSFIRDFWVDHRDSVPQTSKWLDWIEKKKDSPMPEDTVVFQKGVEEGRRLEREDMEKEQKPAEWSEQDIQYYDAVIDMITNALYLPCRPRDEIINWFKNLRPQPKIGWSEEDEKQIRQIERIVKNAGCSKMLQEKIHNWLKSLRPQSHWKPSEEQMDALSCAKRRITIGGELYNILESLYGDLKKLM